MKTKTLNNTDNNQAKKNVSDIENFGGDQWKLIQKASSKSEGWLKSTKVMLVQFGLFLQVTTQQKNDNGSYSIAESVTYAPGIFKLVEIKDDSGNLIGREIVPK